MKYVAADTLRQMGHDALAKVGVREDIITSVIDGLVWTSLRGIDSHGIRLLPHYVEGVEGGRLNPDPKMGYEQTAVATGTLDADHTFGHAAGVCAMKNAIELAQKCGIGAVSVRNSSHCGALSYFAHIAAERDMIGMVFTHATARVKTPGSNRAFFGNNPLCMVAPMQGEEPFCFDAATTSTTFNAVKAAAAAGKKLSPGLVADADGYETTDPKLAEQLMPIGGHKGFGLSMMVDILCAVLSGMPNGNDVSPMYGSSMSDKRYLGQFFCAIKIDAFRDANEFKKEMKMMAERLRNEPVVEKTGIHVMVPGDPEKLEHKRRVSEGIPVSEHVLNEIEKKLKVRGLVGL